MKKRKSNRKILFSLAIVALLVLGVWISWGIYISSTAEDVGYRILESFDGGIEIREYEKQTLITTIASSDNSAFGPLGNYIFGNNQRNEKIAMTAPVITTEENGVMEMSFILPKGYTPDNAPTPNSKRVTISEIEGRTIATITFSGYTSDQIVQEKEQLLRQTLQQEQILTINQAMLWRYNDPWTPPFMRRNEVAMEVILN